MDSPIEIRLLYNISSDQLRRLLPPTKVPLLYSRQSLGIKQPVNPKKENTIQQRPFKVRRKPVPRLSDLPSSPTPAPRNPKDALIRDIAASFPALDSGNIGHYYQLGPEILESSGELRIHNLIVKKLLGIGGQGRVYLAQGPSEDQTVFAVKVIFKSRHVHYDDILREQKVMRRLRGNRFLLQLEASFHDKKNFYLVTVRKSLIQLIQFNHLLTLLT